MAAQNRDPIRNKQRSHSTTINSRFLSAISVNYFQFQRTPASARSGKRYSHPPAVTRAFFSPSGKVLSFPSKVRKKRRKKKKKKRKKKKKKTEGTRRRTVRKQRDVPLHLRGTHSLYLRVSSSGIDEGKLDKTGEEGTHPWRQGVKSFETNSLRKLAEIGELFRLGFLQGTGENVVRSKSETSYS